MKEDKFSLKEFYSKCNSNVINEKYNTLNVIEDIYFSILVYYKDIEMEEVLRSIGAKYIEPNSDINDIRYIFSNYRETKNSMLEYLANKYNK